MDGRTGEPAGAASRPKAGTSESICDRDRDRDRDRDAIGIGIGMLARLPEENH
jgi:hypothetical protein